MACVLFSLYFVLLFCSARPTYYQYLFKIQGTSVFAFSLICEQSSHTDYSELDEQIFDYEISVWPTAMKMRMVEWMGRQMGGLWLKAEHIISILWNDCRVLITFSTKIVFAPLIPGVLHLYADSGTRCLRMIFQLTTNWVKRDRSNSYESI